MDNQNEEMQEQPVPIQNMEEGLPTPTQEDIQGFIISIKSGNIDQMKEYIDKFSSNICNRLQSQLRQPPLYFASVTPNEQVCHEMIKLLVEAGANPNFKDSNEQTIMFYICRDGKKKTAQYLIENGCGFDEEDLYGQTPVFYIVSENRVDMLQLVPESLLNHVDKLAKQTPLYYAARKGHFEMSKMLVQRGCDPCYLDAHKKTPIQYAKKARFQEVADYLSQEAKKQKDLNKAPSQSAIDSELNENTKRKKKDGATLNNNKNIYKITVMKENGQTHDLTEEQVKQLMKNNSQLQTYLANPQNIPQQMLESTLQESWQKVAAKVFNNCWKVKGSFWFHEPVDTVKYGILDYNDIISKPMDLGTVKKRLSHNFYANAKEFVDQIRLVWKNCYRYNGNEHQISKFARQMENAFEESFLLMGLNKYIDE